jgi:hypothetical protein
MTRRGVEGEMDWRALSIVLCLSLHCVGIVGCASDSSKGTLTGTVTLDGQPLESGLIRFIPVDGQTPTADATINAGQFTAEVPIGEKRISISAPKVVGKRKVYETPDAPTIDIVQELLPARYNVGGELMMTVQPGRQQKDFALTSGK